MAFSFNPFTGNFDDVKDVAEKAENSGGATTDNSVVRFDGTTGLLIQDSQVTIDDSGNMIIAGDLTVNGTTTTVNSATLDVTDANITVNNNGNDASAEGAGLTIERTGTDGSFIYADACVTKFKVGALGSEIEVVDISSVQTLTNKTIDADNNTILDIANANIATAAAIQFSKMESLTASRMLRTNGSGVVEATGVSIDGSDQITGLAGLQFTAGVNINGVLDEDDLVSDSATAVPTQQSVKAYVDTEIQNVTFNVVSINLNTAAVVNRTYFVDTSAAVTITLPAPVANGFIRVKDENGNANTNNITVNPNGAETIDGAASFTMDSDFEAKNFVSDGTNWKVL